MKGNPEKNEIPLDSEGKKKIFQILEFVLFCDNYNWGDVQMKLFNG